MCTIHTIDVIAIAPRLREEAQYTSIVRCAFKFEFERHYQCAGKSNIMEGSRKITNRWLMNLHITLRLAVISFSPTRLAMLQHVLVCWMSDGGRDAKRVHRLGRTWMCQLQAGRYRSDETHICRYIHSKRRGDHIKVDSQTQGMAKHL